MTSRKQLLVAAVAALAAPLAASAAPLDRTHSPLSHWAAVAQADSGQPTAGDRGEGVSYPLTSYDATEQGQVAVARAGADAAAPAKDAPKHEAK